MTFERIFASFSFLTFFFYLFQGDDLAIDCIEDATHGVAYLSLSRIDSVNVYSTLPNVSFPFFFLV